MYSGHVKIHRDTLNDPLWDAEPFSKGQAWLDLLLNARREPGSVAINGCVIHIDRGQVGLSEIQMSKRWWWSRNKVRRLLTLLEGAGRIVLEPGHKTTIITISDYDHYAPDEEGGC